MKYGEHVKIMQTEEKNGQREMSLTYNNNNKQ